MLMAVDPARISLELHGEINICIPGNQSSFNTTLMSLEDSFTYLHSYGGGKVSLLCV